jgi:probable F420-dependent oxidoreductase
VRIGAKLRNYGAGATMASILEEARRAEAACFDSVWLSDHLVMPEWTESFYPYGADGRVTWDPREPWFDPVVVFAALAAITERVGLGVAVMVVALREPVVLAKQLACVTELSAGRLVLGVGDGWLREELELFGVDFARRRARTDEVLDVCRRAWTGELSSDDGSGTRRFFVEPRPRRPVPVFLGGSSDSVLSRVARHGYGWLPLQRGAGAAAAVGEGLRRIGAVRSGTTGAAATVPRVILNAGTAEDIAPELPALCDLGVEEILVDGDFDQDDGPKRTVGRAREVLG